jgi:hypothetical protein
VRDAVSANPHLQFLRYSASLGRDNTSSKCKLNK